MAFTGNHELLTPDDVLRAMIRDGASPKELQEHAGKISLSLRDDARANVVSGLISADEAARVLGED